MIQRWIIPKNANQDVTYTHNVGEITEEEAYLINKYSDSFVVLEIQEEK